MTRNRKKWGGKKAKKRKVANKGIRTKEPLTPEQQEAILKVAEKMGDFEYRTVLVLLETGMHPCVLANDCEESTPDLRIWGNNLQWTRPKNDFKVSMPIPQRLREWIEEYLASERPQYRQWYNRLLRDIGAKAKVPRLSPLSLRHTFAVNRLNDGYELHDLQHLMGTRDLKSLAHYTVYSPAYMEKRYKGREW